MCRGRRIESRVRFRDLFETVNIRFIGHSTGLGSWNGLDGDEPGPVPCLSVPLRASLTLFMSPDMLAVRCNSCMDIGS